MKTIIAAEPLYAMLDGARLFDRSTTHLLMAKDGYEVLSTCRNRQVELVLLTQTVGSVSGLSVVRALKRASEEPRVIMVLSDGDVPALRAAAGAGCDEVFVEPVEAEVLLNAAARVLGVAARQGLRVLTRIRCEGSGPGREMLMGTIVDLSWSGMGVESEGGLKVGETVNAEFYLPGSNEACVVTCKVMRADPGESVHQYGLQFVATPKGLATRIHAFVNARQRPPAKDTPA